MITNKDVRILILEDYTQDYQLVVRVLRKGRIPFVSCWADSRDPFLKQLSEFQPDLILSDYNLPGFDGLSALQLVRRRFPEMPFILLSGTCGEEQATEALISGATDYLLKSRLDRLVPVVQRAIREISEREERKRLELQFQQAQKMEAIGNLAGGIAHDFNNMIMVISGYASIAIKSLPSDSPLRPDILEIQKAAERSAVLTRQLLTFARKQAITPKVLDFNDIITGMLKMLGRLIGEDIELLWIPGHNLGPVLMDPSQLDQILANLVVNARDAIVGVGKVTIETSKVEFDDDFCNNHMDFNPGQYVLLAVSDNGRGMSKETMFRIFEPFFTTKPSGEGTGLGLATVYGIVKQNNGFINVYSELGQGTTFRIYMPRHTAEVSIGPAVQPFEAKTGTETILLVEDEASLLALSKRFLERLGYKVLAVNSPIKAIEMVENGSDEIHLLITDVIMPEMNGRDLSQRLSALRPKLKCLFMSGYTSDIIARHGILDNGIHFLHKPFSLEDMSLKIREALESSY